MILFYVMTIFHDFYILKILTWHEFLPCLTVYLMIYQFQLS